MAFVRPDLVRLAVFLAILIPAHILLALYGQQLPYSYYFENNVKRLAMLEDQRCRDSMEAIKGLRAEMQRSGIKGPLFNRPGEKRLCVSITTVARPGRKYLSQTVAALLTRMPLRFQDRVRITLFNGESNPSDHQEATGLADLLNIVNVRYEKNFDPKASSDVRRFAKELLDYLFAARETYDMGCQYNLMLEDDALASTHWAEDLERTLGGLEAGDKPWIVLRLFSTFNWIGFSKDDLTDYVLLAVLTLALSGAIYLLGLGSVHLASLVASGWRDKERYEPLVGEPSRRLLVVQKYKGFDLFSTGLLLGLTFALILLAGKHTIIHRGDGVHDISTGASCVANLYPRRGLWLLIDHLDSTTREHEKSNQLSLMPRKDQFFDVIIRDQYKRTGIQYTDLICLPNLFQHTGIWTSLGKPSSPKTAIISPHYRDDDARIKFPIPNWTA